LCERQVRKNFFIKNVEFKKVLRML